MTGQIWCRLTLSLLAVAGIFARAHAQTTAFTYQGLLKDAGAPANSTYDMQFKLFDTPSLGTGTQQGAAVTDAMVAISDGVFTVTLDFGANVFTGAARYLEIGVRPAGSAGARTVLSPRQPITASPYAIQTLNAQQLGGVPANRFVQTTASGNVGIGTANPSRPLHIQGSGEVALRIEGDADSPDAQVETSIAGVRRWTFGSTGNNHPTPNSFYVYQDTSSNNAAIQQTRLLIDDNGNVGVGTTAPQAKLHVEADTAGFGLFSRNTFHLFSQGGGGIFGQTTSANGTGVLGRYDGPASDSGWGVFGYTPTGYAGVFGSGAKNGVFGQTSSASDSGVFGKNDGSGAGVTGTSATGRGVYGRSDGASDGVVGESHTANHSGVYGFTTETDGCGGCFQNTAGGRALGVTGNAVQSRDGGGLVKAMVYVHPFPTTHIERCYNSQATGSAVSTPPCGFSAVHRLDLPGRYYVDFGFPIDDRFVSLTPVWEAVSGVTGSPKPLVTSSVSLSGPYVNVTTGYSSSDDGTDVPFFIIVY